MHVAGTVTPALSTDPASDPPAGAAPATVVGRDGAWCVWQLRADVVAVVVRDAVAASDAEGLAHALEAALGQACSPIRLFIDARDLDRAGCGVVAAEILWSASRAFTGQHVFAGVGMLHAVGVSGVLIAGWTRLLGDAYPSLVSPHLDEVLAFLDLATYASRWTELRDSAHDASAAQLVSALRARPRLRIAELAEALGIGVAELRRQLSQRGTTFREESLRRRLDLAREALAQSGAKLDSVAREAGFNSGSHLATALRRQGSSPLPSAPPPPGSVATLEAPHACELPRLVDLADFQREPLGKCHVSAAWLIWQIDASLAMCSVFGPMGAQELADLFACIDAVMNASAAPLDVLSDATLGRLEDIGSQGMAHLYAYTSEQRERLTRCIRRHAITATDTPAGAFLGGLGEVNEARHPWRVMATIDEALRWFGRDDGPTLARRMSDLIANGRRGGALLLDIEVRLRPAPTLPIGELARSLGMSVRSLQRACRDHGTSFRAIQRQAIVARACELLLTTEMKIAGIAQELGLRSRSHFISLFRGATGSSPSDYRRARGVRQE